MDRQEIASLLERSAAFPRSRAELVRRVLSDPGALVPLVVRLGSRDVDDSVNAAEMVLRQALQRQPGGELEEAVRNAVTVRPTHFGELALELNRAAAGRAKGAAGIREWAASLLRTADVCGDGDRADLAVGYGETAIRLLRRIRSPSPEDLEALAEAGMLHAQNLELLGRIQEGRAVGRAAVQTASRLRSPTGRRIHALCLIVLGTSSLAEDDIDAASKELGSGYRILQRLGATTGEECSHLAEAASGMAAIHLCRGRLGQARRHADRAYDVASGMAAEDPGRFLRSYLSICLMSAMVAARCGDRILASSRREASVAHLLNLHRQHPGGFEVALVWHLTEVIKSAVVEADHAAAGRWVDAGVRVIRGGRFGRSAEHWEAIGNFGVAALLAAVRRGGVSDTKRWMRWIRDAARRLPVGHPARGELVKAIGMVTDEDAV